MKLISLCLCIVLTIIMAGCGAGEPQSVAAAQSDSQNADTQQAEDNGAPAAPIEVEVAGVEEGVELLRTFVKDFKKQLESDDREKASETSLKMAAVWNAIQADISGTNPEVHNAVADRLSQLTEKVQEKNWDVQAMIELDYELYQELRKISGN
ncbi:hypothetical protein [Paenibacillus alkalitolerans]|uniref:hypothetical protein n=1 Tax=Paenibacillus alkalitolerans TaxID=2799335 RepID=UPI0018F67F18|nr:hypothetical protein [Paenibacillus alkalitolerans]